MTGDVIKSFLVGLGFDVDDASLAKFNKAIASAGIKVAALYGSIKLTSAAILYGISKISEGFEQMGYEYRIISPMINKALVLRRELLKAYAAAGINITKVVQNSVRLNMSLAKTKFAFQAIYQSVASRFFTTITKQSDIFREKLYKNMPLILNTLERLVKFVFKALDATVALGSRLFSILSRVYDFFVQLDTATNGWSTVVLGLVAAWKFLNLAFLATPLGMLLTGFLALLALWDDFQTFMEGGQSLINWGSEMTKIIVGLIAVLGTLAIGIGAVRVAFAAWSALSGIITLIKNLDIGLAALELILLVIEAPFWAIAAAIGAVIAALVLVDAKWKLFGGHLSDFFAGLGGKVMGFLSSPNVAANLQNNPTAPMSGGAPLGGHTQNNSQSNQHVNQQTTINVNGTPDAASVGKSVSGEQSRVNFDMVRNLKGATR